MNRNALFVASLVIASLLACGGGERMPQSGSEQMPQSQAFNSVLNAGAISGPRIFSLVVSATKQGEKIYLSCRLRNVSDHAVRIDDEYLPWNTLGMITAIAFDERGKQLRTNLSLGGLFAEGNYHDMAPAQELAGSIDMETFLYAGERPLAGDVLFRWVYLPKLEYSNTKQRALSGTTLLPEELR